MPPIAGLQLICPQGLDALRDEQRACTASCRGERGLGAGMAATTTITSKDSANLVIGVLQAAAAGRAIATRNAASLNFTKRRACRS